MDVTRVAGSSAQANSGDGVGKPEAKGKHEMDLSEVWAAIFAQAGALYHTAGHAAANAKGEVRESPAERAETPSAAETSLVRAPGDVSTERMLSQGWAMVHRPSATATPSDGIQRADGGAEGTPQAADRLLDRVIAGHGRTPSELHRWLKRRRRQRPCNVLPRRIRTQVSPRAASSAWHACRSITSRRQV